MGFGFGFVAIIDLFEVRIKFSVHEKEYTGDGADEPTTMEKMKKKFWDAENHLKGKESSAVEDPHPELSYITPMPEQKKESLLSKIEQKFQGHGDDNAPKGTGSNELGTGYEEDAEDKINPAVVPNVSPSIFLLLCSLRFYSHEL